MRHILIAGMLAAAAALAAAPRSPAQVPASAAPATPGQPAPADAIPAWARQSPYPRDEVDKAAAERGRALYVNNSCSFCHGPEIRGGDTGPSLLRSAIVLADKNGEKIAPILRRGVPGTAMPAFDLTDAQIADLAAFLHSFKVDRGGGLMRPAPTIVVGSAEAGRAYFQANCAQCHSPTGDLAGLATRYTDPVQLQHAWLSPKAKTPMSATVTMADGTTITGVPKAIDEFSITLTMADGSERVIARDGDRPAISIRNPLAAHEAMIRKYADKDIHDTTAFLVTLK